MAPGVERALQSAMDAVEKVDVLMHPTRVGSDLERICGARSGTDTVVDPWTFAVLRQSAQLNLQTRGLFDPCLASEAGRMPDITLHEPDIVTCNATVAIDLGGIAKGFAIDRAIDALQEHGCTSGLVNAGGDMRVFGPRSHSIRVRISPSEVVQIELVDSALAASAPRSSTSPSEHLGFYMGTTGAKLAGQQVAVIAPQAMIADALCKCALACEPAALAALLQQHSARLLRSG
jgi:FAD:protein FMN transferase